MMGAFRISVGGEDFDEIRQKGSYYVDKSGLIYDLVNGTENKVTLFTRPRRFGKTLAMSMIQSFFDITRDSRAVFDGLEVTKHEDFCREWMNQRPALFVTFKNAKALNFDDALDEMRTTLSNVCLLMPFLSESDRISEEDKALFSRLRARETTLGDIKSSLFVLTRMLNAHFGKKVVLLIDEYDVPLAWANENDYYKPMLDVIRSVFEYAVKTNPYLEFAVVTGCLRVAKESIFTGTNNFASYSILNRRFSPYFGFTQTEVGKILKAAGLEDKAEIIKSWYDGYIFGDSAVYCPWDVANYVAAAVSDPKAEPKNYWNNTSHNGVVRSFIGRTDYAVKPKFEALMNGGTIRAEISDELTYDLLHSSEQNLWSLLFMTGYLTKADPEETGSAVSLRIPNREISNIFETAAQQWFCDTLDRTAQGKLFSALWEGNEASATEILSNLLWQTVSFHDYREDYYHGFLMGVFTGAGYAVDSNREYGLGRADMVVLDPDNRRAMLIETKKAEGEARMGRACEDALAQIAEKKYAEDDSFYGYRTILCYGVAFYRKSALVKKL
ncbi:MAG: AAA family ATPase [Synergistaceae bacterium]|nr:AAA family ATPase [Synergistaceae bacterium]